MKTKQEQIKAIKKIIDERVETNLGQVQGRHGNVIKTVGTVIIARDIVNAGYGDVSEYKNEIERLKAEYEKLKTHAEMLAKGIRNLLHEKYELTQKLAKQTRIARDANAKCTGAERYLRPFQYKADRLETKCNDLKRLSDWQREEIKRLKAEVNKGCDNCEAVKQAKIDVLKRLKVFSEPYPNSWGIYVIDVYHIDELIKEVQNEN